MENSKGGHAYPRPDFQRPGLNWTSLNGSWDFIFDDEDVGLSQYWQQKGLPAEVAIRGTETSGETKDEGASWSDTITQRIAAGTQELLKDNSFVRDTASSTKKRQITVPFVFQSPASGINDRGIHEVLWYERTIADLRTAAERERGYRLILRFGAVDYEASAWINGQYVGGHRGGHVPFELDVTDAIEAAQKLPSAESRLHRLTVRVFDSAHNLTQPRGKQYWGAKPESIFYTPSGGIWQSVWLEAVPPARVADSSHGLVIRSNDIELGDIYLEVPVVGARSGHTYFVAGELSFAGQVVIKSPKVEVKGGVARFQLCARLSKEDMVSMPSQVLQNSPLEDSVCWQNGVALWTPEHPQLYDLTLRLTKSSSDETLDVVQTTTGMRSLDWSNPDGWWRLNGKPYFQALCLDQGYWPDTFMTPPTQDSLKEDIELAKKMGFNGCRKHQKVEDPAFYYWADRLGYLVWAEMANAYEFSREYAERFSQEWIESVKLAINHPSVVTWTPVNESWGYPSLKDNVEQRNHIRALYYVTKTLDSTRSINDNCGWEHVCTDLSTFHDYADGPELEKTCADLNAILGPKAGRDLFVKRIEGVDDGAAHRPGAPIMCTEFGGVNIAAAKTADGAEPRDWGYTTASDPEDLLRRISRLVKGVTGGGRCCAFVYTQLTDIEQEANGLYSFDRKAKLDADKVKALIDEAIRMFYDSIK